MDIDVLKSIIVEGQEVLEEVNPVQRKYSLEECPRCVFVGGTSSRQIISAVYKGVVIVGRRS